MASIMAQEASKHCHSVIVGDAEDLWLDVLKDVEADTMKSVYERKLTKLQHHYQDLILYLIKI